MEISKKETKIILDSIYISWSEGQGGDEALVLRIFNEYPDLKEQHTSGLFRDIGAGKGKDVVIEAPAVELEIKNK